MSASDDKLPEYPKRDDRELGYSVTRGTLGSVPGLGPALQELLNLAVLSPLQKRRDEWFRVIGEALHDLQERLKGFDPSDMANNEEFLSIVHHTTDVAMRSHQAEKLEILRNVVMNAAAGLKLDDVLRGQFMAHVERFSPAHIRVLQVLQNPSSWQGVKDEQIADKVMGGLAQTIEAAIPEFKGQKALLENIVRELELAGLAKAGLNVTMTGRGMIEKRTTPVGDDFLTFVSAPWPRPSDGRLFRHLKPHASSAAAEFIEENGGGL